MIAFNPFRRTRYVLRTPLSPEEASQRLIATMNAYNATARGRFLMATAFGERFTAEFMPGAAGSRGSGGFLRHFAVETRGLFHPARDGTVDLTIGFQRATSLVQVVIRLGLVGLVGLAIWTLTSSPIVPVFSVAFGIAIAPLILLWSLVAWVQGMWQANRDWTLLMQFVSTALASPHIERVSGRRHQGGLHGDS